MAVEDLSNIAEYIAHDSEYYAKDFIKRIIDRVENLPANPLIGRVVPELGVKELREIIYHNYRIVYRVTRDELIILIISHGSYDLTGRLNKI